MRNQTKKLLGFVAAATMLASTLAFSACGDYKLNEKLDMPTGETVVSNGGFAVQKGDYIYFINGSAAYTVDNTYGEVVKGSLMRIKADMSGEAEVVIPALVGSQNFDAGIYIFGDYVYYATPTTDKNIQGVVENSWIDFKRAKLDGSETMSGYFFRLSSNTTKYRYVEVDGTVYCLYEEDSQLKSYNVKTGKTFVLAKGAGTFFYDKNDATDPYVYYTMGVTEQIDSNKSTTTAYNQIYRVRADATAEVNAKEASYTVKGGRTYDFDEAYMKQVNEDAKETAKEENTEYEPTYDFNDYATYPYVNLGELVVDGIGKNCDVHNEAKLPYNNSALKNEYTMTGYKYTITRYQDGAVYYTKTTEKSKSTDLYYYDVENAVAETGKEVKANENSDVVASSTTNVTDSTITYLEGGAHYYLYVSGNNIYRVKAEADGSVLPKNEVKLCSNVSGATLWKTEGDHLYFYTSASNGYALSRINYKGAKEQYHDILNLEEDADFRPVTVEYVDFASSWYKPEIFGNTMLFANAKSIGTSSYNYIYKTTLGTAEEIEANNDKYEEANEYIDGLSVDVGNAAKYFFRTYLRGVEDSEQNFFIDFEDVKAEYKAANDGKEISWAADFVGEEGTVEKFKSTYIVESDLVQQVSAISESDEEAMREAWKAQLPYPVEEEEESEGLPWWAITLIVVGSVLVVGAAVTVLCVMIMQKKKKQAEDDAIVNAHKKVKIDTTDDKSIDVYADETPAEEETEASEQE